MGTDAKPGAGQERHEDWVSPAQVIAARAEVFTAATRFLMGTALDLIQADPHSWSSRGCQTCTAVSAIVGRKFGCLVTRAKESR